MDLSKEDMKFIGVKVEEAGESVRWFTVATSNGSSQKTKTKI